MSGIRIGKKVIGKGHPAYIISEVGSNFDGDLGRAKYLAKLSKEVGADAYKIQNFLAPKIVSSVGFENLQVAFQKKWDKSVVEVYKNAEFPRQWLDELAQYCQEIGIDFFSAPYDIEAVELLEGIGVPVHKIGSGEIDNLEFVEYIARTNKPIFIACGSATMEEVENAIDTIRKTGNDKIVMMQCVTNYPSPLADANVRAMVAIQEKFDVEVGYSDHSGGVEGGGDDPLGGITVPMCAVALGACVIEKHFTDDRTRKGPDHPFAADPGNFRRMVEGIRAIERALGDGNKRVMPSEQETVIIQRRGVYATRDIRTGETITRAMTEFLRPALGLRPPAICEIIGKPAKRDIAAGNPIYADDINI